MADSKGKKPDELRPVVDNDLGAGRVVHDSRGNAVWDWVKETTRVAIDSTSRLLRKLWWDKQHAEDEDARKRAELDAKFKLLPESDAMRCLALRESRVTRADHDRPVMVLQGTGYDLAG